MTEYDFCLNAAARGSVDKILVLLPSGIEEIKQTQKMHSTMLQSRMRQVKGSDSMATVAQLPEGVQFPLETLAEIDG